MIVIGYLDTFGYVSSYICANLKLVTLFIIIILGTISIIGYATYFIIQFDK